MPTIRDLLSDATTRFVAAAIDAPDRTAAWLLGDVLGRTRVQLLTEAQTLVPPEEGAQFEALVQRRLAHEPLQYILGYTEFYGLRIEVTPDVLIPRPETEQVVEHALGLLRDLPAPRILDIGTGSGCIALALRHVRPDATVFGCDISPDALAVARRNADALALPATFIHADALAPDFPAQVPGPFDLIISNPPYIPDAEAPDLTPEVHEHEPHLALFTGDDPLRFYRAITRHATSLLHPGGHLVFETHADHAVAPLLQDEGFADVRMRRDYAGMPRMVDGRWYLPR